jgi:hypothetical protein
LFSVFFSVSTLAGLIWRSPILAIGVTTIFGSVCMVVGIIGGLFDGLVTRPESVRQINLIGQTMMGSTRGGGLVWFDGNENRWVEVFESNALGADRSLPPIALNADTAATAQVRGGRFNPFGSGALDLLVLNRQDDWTPEPSLRLPTATSSLYVAGDEVLAMSTGELALVTQTSILQAAGAEKEASQDDQPSSRSESGGSELGGWLTKLTNMMGGATSGFTSILPERVSITPPRSLLVDRDGRWLMALTRGRLFRLQRADSPGEPWGLTADRTLDGEASRRGVIAVSGDVLMVARNEEPIQILRAEDLETLAAVELPTSLSPVAAVGLPGDGRFLLLTSDGRCRQVCKQTDSGQEYIISDPLGPHQVETIHFDQASERLYVVHHIDRVEVMDPQDFRVVEQIKPSLNGWRLVDRYVISPLRLLIPQTGELGETIEAMVSGKSALTIENGSEQGEVVRYDIVRPVLSCALFIAVMLTVSCLYFATRDF